MSKKHESETGKGELLMYRGKDGDVKLEVQLQDETIWLTINQMAALFGVDKSGISRHLKRIYETGELQLEATVAKFATVQNEGGRSVARDLEYYNLDAIISVGYRVNSILGTQFRIWASERLKEYLVKGFAMDDDRLKQSGGGSYFDELLARIRDIRSSEKVFWRKVLDIYATSIDYDPKTDVSRRFFKVIQNKMHWAAHGQTAAEVIFQRADAAEPDMGMTNWVGSTIRKSESEIAKNYLTAEELDLLNRIVTLYLDFAELQAVQRKDMTMQEWIEKLDDFLRISGRDVLTHAGKIRHDAALQKAHAEYELFRRMQLDKPTEMEKHFVEEEKEIKAIEANLARPGRKPASTQNRRKDKNA